MKTIARQAVLTGVTTLCLDRLKRAAERREMRRTRSQLVRVFFVHDTPPAHRDRFRRQLAWLRSHFHLIDFDTFRGLLDRTVVLDSDRPAALMTFDDGLASNYEVAAPLLEEAGARGLFFVVAGFSAVAGDPARQFYCERIRPGSTTPQDPMTPQQIRDLARRGHTIGNHTFSHPRLSELPEADYEAEIVESAALIESWAGQRVDAFAWPFTWDAITPAAHRAICERHQYCFSPCPGRTDPNRDSARLIWRRNIEPQYSPAEFAIRCSGLADPLSAHRRRRLAQTLLDSSDAPGLVGHLPTQAREER